MTTKNYRHNHRDLNEQQLVKTAEALGLQWLEEGPLDGWVWHPREKRWMPVEIKRPAREGQVHEYTPMQRRFFTWCRERNAPWWVWRTIADVIRDAGGRLAATHPTEQRRHAEQQHKPEHAADGAAVVVAAHVGNARPDGRCEEPQESARHGGEERQG